MFKGCAPMRRFRGRSATDGAACGVHLRGGGRYLLFVDRITNDVGEAKPSFVISACQFNRRWRDVGGDERRFLRMQRGREENECRM